MGIERRLGDGRSNVRGQGIEIGWRRGSWRRRRAGGNGKERQLRGEIGSRWRRRSGKGRDRLPERGDAAAFAGAENAFVGGADVGLDAGVVDIFARVAGSAKKSNDAELLFRFADGRKIDLPEIEIQVEESDAVGMTASLLADVADNADVGFLVFFGPAEDELLFGRKLMAREDACAVQTEEDGAGAFGEHAAVQIGTDEEDGNFLRNAGRATHGEEGASGRPWRRAARDNLVPGEKTEEVES